MLKIELSYKNPWLSVQERWVKIQDRRFNNTQQYIFPNTRINSETLNVVLENGLRYNSIVFGCSFIS